MWVLLPRPSPTGKPQPSQPLTSLRLGPALAAPQVDIPVREELEEEDGVRSQSHQGAHCGRGISAMGTTGEVAQPQPPMHHRDHTRHTEPGTARHGLGQVG